MKKVLILMGLIFLGVIFSYKEISSNQIDNEVPYGYELKMEDESYVDDIPFDTKSIFDTCQKNNIKR